MAKEKPLQDIERDFEKASIPEDPQFVSDHTEFLLEKLVAHSVHTASPKFIGHMTSALPYFLMPLAKLMVGLNQNLVKIETSKAFTPLERNVIGMLHHLVYQRESSFYNRWMHSAQHSLGAFCSGGTVANMTALWVARNQLLKPDGDFAGIAAEGLAAGLAHYNYKRLVVLVSERGHYSLSKAMFWVWSANLVPSLPMPITELRSTRCGKPVRTYAIRAVKCYRLWASREPRRPDILTRWLTWLILR